MPFCRKIIRETTPDAEPCRKISKFEHQPVFMLRPRLLLFLFLLCPALLPAQQPGDAINVNAINYQLIDQLFSKKVDALRKSKNAGPLGSPYPEKYMNALARYIELYPAEFVNWVESDFQLMRYPKFKDPYCKLKAK